MITIAFIVAVVLLGRWLFNPKDWGKHKSERPQGPGTKFPPVPK